MSPLEGKFADIDGRTAQKIRKNEIKIEARLDLHGMTEAEAFEAVPAFIKKSYAKKLRCILIITGKGQILQPQVPKWLRLPTVKPLILSVTNPEPRLGGTGALYILLRRQRD